MKDILKFKGTVGRQRWWITMLLLLFPVLYIEAMIEAFDKVEPTFGSLLVMFIAIFVAFFLWYVKLTTSVARIKETGASGWWVLFPFVNFIIAGFVGPSRTVVVVEKE